MSEIDELQKFLWNHKIKTGDKETKSTHTRIGKKNTEGDWVISPGNYHIKVEELEEFWINAKKEIKQAK